ncbi:MAG: hypothetical protein KDA58_09580, partial [Planctomycetaceae bacterium]|nr:hypothetical protein [Planctomycetaceae bacterium]
ASMRWQGPQDHYGGWLRHPAFDRGAINDYVSFVFKVFPARTLQQRGNHSAHRGPVGSVYQH